MKACSAMTAENEFPLMIQRKPQIILVLLVLCAFLFQSCSSVIFGTSKKIPVTSNPLGAKVIVDGKEMGHTPLNLRLKRKNSHIVRIEKNGYNPFEIRITRKVSGALVFSILGNYWVGYLGMIATVLSLVRYPSLEHHGAIMLGLLLAYWSGTIVLDFISGANYFLSPGELALTLTKIDGKTSFDFILIDAEKFQNIKWIRIKCVDSEEDEIVNLN